MKVTDIQVVQNRKPVVLPEAWQPAWMMPDVQPIKTMGFAFIQILTDEGVTGVGPGGLPEPVLERVKAALVGQDPRYVEAFWQHYICQSGGRGIPGRESLGGVDTALWDIVGKVAGKPVYQLLGACRDRVPVYIATTQLHSPAEHAREAVAFREQGARAIKLRLHRPDYRDDLAVVRAVRDAVGPDMDIMVDGNQNNWSPSYRHWSRRVAMAMAKTLDALDVYYFEDPLPLRDREGLRQLADAVEMYISGGEHAQDIFEHASLLLSGALDIVETDITLGSRLGMTGAKKVAHIAEALGRRVIPHVATGPNKGLHLAASLQVAATVPEWVCPFVEYIREPPALTPATQQFLLTEPILFGADGCVPVPQKPGIGVELNDAVLTTYL